MNIITKSKSIGFNLYKIMIRYKKSKFNHFN